MRKHLSAITIIFLIALGFSACAKQTNPNTNGTSTVANAEPTPDKAANFVELEAT